MTYKGKKTGKCRQLLGGIALSALMCLTSCMADEPAPGIADSESIRVKAALAEELATRGDIISSGSVTSGTYYIMYTLKSNSNYTINSVLFNKDVMDKEGYVPSGLQWNLIKDNRFYMDNVDTLLNKGKEKELVIFNAKNPFVAGPLVPEEEREEDYVADNDLLWGPATPAMNAKTIDFSLHHAMSKLKVQVTVDKENVVGDEFDFEKATLTISNIVTEPYSYNRKTGQVSLAEEPEYNEITLVNMAEEVNGLSWASIEVDNDNSNKITFTTFDYIVPPQSLQDNESRPKLTIRLKSETLGKEKVYSGYLPHAMELVYAAQGSAPLTLAFLREHYLTIRTELRKDPPELLFQPVWVYKWVDKGEFTVDGYQAGVYNSDDFEKLIEYYNSNNETQLRRFGKQNADGSWVFNLFGNMELEKSEIYGKMIPGGNKPSYSFNLDYLFTITIMDNGEIVRKLEGQAGGNALYGITSGTSN